MSEFLWFCTIGTKTILQINTTLFWLGPLSLNMRSPFLFNRLGPLSLKLYFSCNWPRIWKLFTNFKYPWLNFPSPTLNKFLSFHRYYKVLTPPTTTTEESPKKCKEFVIGRMDHGYKDVRMKIDRETYQENLLNFLVEKLVNSVFSWVENWGFQILSTFISWLHSTWSNKMGGKFNCSIMILTKWANCQSRT